MTQPASDNTAIMLKLGEMSGENKALFQSLFNHLDLIRTDINRVEKSTNERIQHLENHTKDRLNSVEGRLKDLEIEDKSHIKQLAANSVSGGLAGGFITAFVEIIKHIK